MLRSIFNVIENYFNITENSGIVVGNEDVVNLAIKDPKPLYDRLLSEAKDKLRIPLKNFGLSSIETNLLKLELIFPRLFTYLYSNDSYKYYEIFKRKFCEIADRKGILEYFYYLIPNVDIPKEGLLVDRSYLGWNESEFISNIKKSIDKFNITKDKYCNEVDFLFSDILLYSKNHYSDYDKKVILFLKACKDYE